MTDQAPLKLYMDEPLSLMVERWAKLDRELFDKKKGTFNVSKLPDVYDSIKWVAPGSRDTGCRIGKASSALVTPPPPLSSASTHSTSLRRWAQDTTPTTTRTWVCRRCPSCSGRPRPWQTLLSLWSMVSRAR